MKVIKGCFKFIESDVFFYVESRSKVFIVYVDQLAFIKEVTEDASSSKKSESVLSQSSRGIPATVIEKSSENTIRESNYSAQTIRSISRSGQTVKNLSLIHI